MKKMNCNIKKILLAALLLFIPSIALAQFESGESEDKGTVTTIEELKNKGDLGKSDGLLDMVERGAKTDDRFVIMEGYILERIEGDAYEFKDETGTIYIEIPEEAFGGVKVTPKDLIRVYGETDYEDAQLVVEIDRLELVKK